MVPSVLYSEFFSPAHFNKAYEFAAAPAALAEWVAYTWHSRFELLEEGHEALVRERLFAHLSSSIVFSHGDPFTVERGSESFEVSGGMVIGQQTSPLLFRHSRGNRLLGLKLKPGGFYRLLGIPAALIRDEIIPLKELLPTATALNNDPVSLYRLLTERSTRSDAFRSGCVQKALHLYLSHVSDNPPLEKLARELHLTPRTLGRYFHETLGLSPKKACSISRIRSALQAYASGHHFSLYDFGYTDRSHFHKDLRAYTSLRSLSPG